MQLMLCLWLCLVLRAGLETGICVAFENDRGATVAGLLSYKRDYFEH